MGIELLDARMRWALIGAAVALAIAAVLAVRRRRPHVGAALGTAALLAGGALLAETLIAVTVRLAARGRADFNEFRWVLLSPWGRLGLGLGGAVVIAILLLAWRSTRGVTTWRRALIIGLRGGAAMTALFLFLEPAIELRQVAREPNRIAILIDDSASMNLAESKNGRRRIDRAAALISASATAFAAWQRDHRIDFYTFSDAVAATSPSALPSEATGKGTLLRKALEPIRGRYDGRDLAGMIIVSDGAATGGVDEDAEDFLKSLDTRVHTVWAARPGLRDLAVKSVLADEFAFVRTVVRIDAVIQATGLGAQEIPVTLSTDGQPLRQKMVSIPPGDHEVRVTFEVTPPRVGRYVFEVAVPQVDGEPVTSNNARAFVVRVLRDKIRVLQVAGQPSWDVRALRQMLKANPNVDLISFFILRTSDDISLVPNDEMSLIPFPTQELFEEQLPSFDLIVLQNFEYLPYGIGDYLESIRAYVEGGGGLAMLGGAQSFASGGYYGTPVAAALPVELPSSAHPKAALDTGRFSPLLTPVGLSHPVTALRYEPADNAAAWRALPPLEGVNVVVGPRAGASVLAVHPTLKADDGKPLPVIVAGDYGKGRSLAVTTDTLWRWGFVAAARPGDDGRQYTHFWENAIRWLIQDPDLRHLHVDSDAVEYAPGAPVRIGVRLLGRDYQPLRGAVSLVIRKGEDPRTARTVQKGSVSTGDDGVGTLEVTAAGPGVYRVEGTATVGGNDATASDIFLVKDGGHELDHPGGDPDLLASISRSTKGSALGPASALPADLAFDPPRIVRVDRRTDVELWSRPGLLVLAVLLLGLEWLLRQRSGTL